MPWGLAMARDQGYECATGTETVAPWRRRIVAAMAWPAFNLITGAAREDAVVEEHFARVFNLDESLADMMRSPRVLAGLLRYKVNSVLGRQQGARSASTRSRTHPGPTGPRAPSRAPSAEVAR